MFVWYVTVLLEYIKNIEEGVSNWWIFANNIIGVCFKVMCGARPI